MSGVSAAPPRTAPPSRRRAPLRAEPMSLHEFLLETTAHDNWRPFFHLMNPGVLETYFMNSIQQLADAVGVFQGTVINRVNQGQSSSSVPGDHLTNLLGNLPKLVFLIRYSHLGFLLNIRPFGYHRPIVAMITPHDVHILSFLNRAVTERQPELLSFEVYTVDIAVLLAMNNEMLGVIQDPDYHAKLVRYRDMLLSLYQVMANYMRIQTWGPYPHIIVVMLNNIIALAGNENIRGYENAVIQQHLRTLSDAILQVITIYGTPLGETGDQWISKIMETREGIRHYLMYRPMYESGPRYSISDFLMGDLSAVLEEAIHELENPGWCLAFLVMVNRMKGLVNGSGH
jgi:hypothetical protein